MPLTCAFGEVIPSDAWSSRYPGVSGGSGAAGRLGGCGAFGAGVGCGPVASV